MNPKILSCATGDQALIRLGAIEFINTVPIYSALDINGITGSDQNSLPVELIYQTPARLNAMMACGELDISPVSSACYLRHTDDWALLEDVSVSSGGAVESVLFLSRHPIGSSEFLKLNRIAVPDDSETSVNLLAWLLKEKTGRCLQTCFEIYPAKDYPSALAEYGAVLVIGDNALRANHAYSKPASENLNDPTEYIHKEFVSGGYRGYHCYDLSSEWVQKQALPFVFAVWAVRKQWASKHPDALAAINLALISARCRFFENSADFEHGIALAKARCHVPEQQIRHYYTQALQYHLSPEHHTSLHRFGLICQELNLNKTPEVAYR